MTIKLDDFLEMSDDMGWRCSACGYLFEFRKPSIRKMIPKTELDTLDVKSFNRNSVEFAQDGQYVCDLFLKYGIRMISRP